jgi:hypothetical protein
MTGTTRKGPSRKLPIIATAAVVALTFLVIPIVGYFHGLTKTTGGEIDVVRNGGLFDDNSIRQVIQPNSGLTSTGLWSTDHMYPASERNFKISAAPGADSDEAIDVSTSDGVPVGVNGTFYFTLNTDEATLKEFDNKFGTRTFPWGDASGGTTALHAYDEGDEGWRAFLRFSLGNLMQTIFREEVGKVKCQDLQSSCSVAINPGASVVPADPEALNKFITNTNLRFSSEVKSVLGGDFFINPRFALAA